VVLREGDLAGDTIVLRGRFNPSIVQPRWLEAQGLFDGRNIEVREEVIMPPLTLLDLGWLTAEITEERAAFSTLDESVTPGPLRDFVVDLFRVLEHTPIYAMGMNHGVHLALSEGGWERIAERLAPAESLRKRFADIAVTSLVWRIPRDDELHGTVNLTVQPSQRLTSGAWSEWNSHVDLSRPEEAAGALPAVEVLQTHWDDDRRRAMDTFHFLRGLA
jgi:hypothetical protein